MVEKYNGIIIHNKSKAKIRTTILIKRSMGIVLGLFLLLCWILPFMSSCVKDDSPYGKLIALRDLTYDTDGSYAEALSKETSSYYRGKLRDEHESDILAARRELGWGLGQSNCILSLADIIEYVNNYSVEDLYGLDLPLETLVKLKKCFPDAFLVFDYQNPPETVEGTYYYDFPDAIPQSRTEQYKKDSSKYDRYTVTYHGDFAIETSIINKYDDGELGWKDGVFYDEPAYHYTQECIKLYYKGCLLDTIKRTSNDHKNSVSDFDDTHELWYFYTFPTPKDEKIWGFYIRMTAWEEPKTCGGFSFENITLDEHKDGKYNQAVALMNAGKYMEAIEVFDVLDGYKDSTKKIDLCTEMLEDKYNEATALIETGKIFDAYEAFLELNGYRDSAYKAKSIYNENKWKFMLKTASKGDIILFGEYEQDNDTANGQEAIEWIVMEIKDGKALVISVYALDVQPYNTTFTEVTWETSTIRKWLNNDFINTAFSDEEQAMIPTVMIHPNPTELGDDPGNATQDKVFLLSLNEVEEWRSMASGRDCYATDYARSKGAYISQTRCEWWLRTVTSIQITALRVNASGECSFLTGSLPVSKSGIAVRPALWIDINF